MDRDGSSSGVDRTFWTVWYYITGAVNRFFNPEPANVPANIPANVPANASERVDSGPTGGDAGARIADEERPPATASLLSSSRPLVAWEFCTTEIDLGAEENVAHKAQPSGGTQRKASGQSEGACGGHVGNEDATRPIADEDEREENRERTLSAGRRDDDDDDDGGGGHGEHANTRWQNLTGDAMSDDVEESGREAGDKEETKRAVTPEHFEEMGEAVRNIHGKEAENKMEHKDEKGLQNTDIGVNICPITDLSAEEGDEVHVHEAESTETHEEVEDTKPFEIQQDFRGDAEFTSLHVDLQTARDNSDIESEDESYAVEGDGVEKAKEADAVIEEEYEKEDSNHRTTEPEDAVETLAGESEREDVLTEDVPRCEEVVQNAEPEPRAADFPDAGQVDVAPNAVVQTETREVGEDETEDMVVKSDGTTTQTSVSAGLFEKDKVEEERLLGEEGKESFMDVAGTLNSVTVESEGETAQEMAAAIKDFPTGKFEGRLAVSALNFPSCEETQKGIPEYNNVPGPDGNTTQVLLEEGDCEDAQGEVGSKAPESLQNSGCGTGADYLVVMEHMEEEQESVGDVKNNFDSGLPQETEKPLQAVTRESGHLIEEEEGESLVDCMKTAIEHTEKEFEMRIGPTDTINKAKNEPQDGLEEILIDLEIDEGSCDPKGSSRTTGASASEETFLKAEEQKMTETSSCHVGELTSEQNRNMAPSSLEDITESGCLKRHDETEAELLEDVKRQEADVKEAAREVEQVVAAEDEMQSQNEMELSHQQVEESVGSPEKSNVQPDEALEINDETLTDSEAPEESKTAESKAEDFTSGVDERSCAEETVSSSSGCQGMVDDEVQQQVDPRTGELTEPYDEEQGEISSLQTEKDEDQRVESNSRESELLGHTETSSSTVETGFVHQSGSFQSLYDTLAIVSESADISELSSLQPNCDMRDTLREEAAETGQTDLKEKEEFGGAGFHPDLEVPSPEAKHQGSAETGSGNEIDVEASDSKDDGEVEPQPQTERSFLYQFEKTPTEDEPQELAASDSPDDIKGTEPEQSTSGSEALLEDEIVPTESRSQSDVCTESERKLPSVDKPQPGWNEGVAESSVGLNMADGAEHSATTSEDQMEVESSALDFTAQRSRISVKNPHVRPPKDARSLLNMPSLDPTPSPHMSPKVPVGGPLGGLGFGIKLPGLGGGFPVLKKTKLVGRDENSPETLSQETKPEERSDTEDETQHKPKWMPPRHPGFGNPLMSELKTKLKKTTKE
ncbi:uncharacterized protein LOC120819056 [Gasterosteus aculeatus]